MKPPLLETLVQDLSTLPDILNIALVISPDVTLLRMGDLLQGLLHAIALLLGIIRALVLFLGIRALLLVSSLLLLLIFGGTHFAIVGVTLLSIIWHILSLLFLNDGGFRHLNSVALLLILLMTLLFLRYIFSLSTSCLPTFPLQVLFLSYYIKLSLYIYVWLQVYI